MYLVILDEFQYSFKNMRNVHKRAFRAYSLRLGVWRVENIQRKYQHRCDLPEILLCDST